MEAEGSSHMMTVRHDAMQVQAKIMILIRVGCNDSSTKNPHHMLLGEEFERACGFLWQESIHRFVEWDLEQVSMMKDVNGIFHRIEIGSFMTENLQTEKFLSALSKRK